MAQSCVLQVSAGCGESTVFKKVEMDDLGVRFRGRGDQASYLQRAAAPAKKVGATGRSIQERVSFKAQTERGPARAKVATLQCANKGAGLDGRRTLTGKCASSGAGVTVHLPKRSSKTVKLSFRAYFHQTEVIFVPWCKPLKKGCYDRQLRC